MPKKETQHQRRRQKTAAGVQAQRSGVDKEQGLLNDAYETMWKAGSRGGTTEDLERAKAAYKAAAGARANREDVQKGRTLLEAKDANAKRVKNQKSTTLKIGTKKRK